jgi:hypothetical protein
MFFAGLNIYTDGGLTLNELGDFLSGGVGPLLSFAALLVLYVAFLGQRQQLQLQQEELRDTRKELAGQRQQLELQNQQTEHRNFENTFFQLIRLHNDIVDAITYEDLWFEGSMRKPIKHTRTVKGRDCFRHFYEDLKDAYDRRETELSVDMTSVMEEITEAEKEPDEESPERAYSPEQYTEQEELRVYFAYKQLWSDHRADLEHYFQSLLQVLSQAVKRKESDNFYIEIVAAQLSTYERLLLAYHYLSDYTPPKLDRYIVKHGILGDLPSDAYLSKSHISAIYAKMLQQVANKDPLDDT